MFMGEYQHTIDIEGRMIVPAKFREELGSQFVVSRGLDKWLFIYRMDEWNEDEEKIQKLQSTKKDARAFTRFFFSRAVERDIDKQGRINISQTLRPYADLDKDCVVIGVSNRVELWSKEVW